MQIGSSVYIPDLSLHTLRFHADNTGTPDDVQLRFEKNKDDKYPVLNPKPVKSSPEENKEIRDAVLKAFLTPDDFGRDEDLHAPLRNHGKDIKEFLTGFLTAKDVSGKNLTIGDIRILLKTLRLVKHNDDLYSNPPSGQKPSSAKGRGNAKPSVPAKANDKQVVPEKANEKTSPKPPNPKPMTMSAFLKATRGSYASKMPMQFQQPQPVNARPITSKNGTKPSVFINKPVNQPVNQAKPNPEGQKPLGQWNVKVVQVGVGQKFNLNDSDKTVVRLSKKVFKNRLDFAKKNLSPDKLRGARPVSQQKKPDPDTETHTGQVVQEEVENRQGLQQGKKKGKRPTTFSENQN